MVYYKFCSLNEWTMYNLYYNNIYFSRVGFLNDSSEFSINFIDDTPSDSGSYFDVLFEVSRFLESVDINSHFEFKTKTIDALEKLKSRHGKSSSDGISDKEKLALFLIGSIGEYFKTTSFTVEGSISNPIMWGHYANSCTGVCVGYDLSNKELVKVKYINSDEIPKIKTSDILKGDFRSLAEKVVSCKSKDWSYEKEYRMILEDEIIDVGNGAVKELVFGYKADFQKVKFAIDLTRERNPDVSLYVAYPTKSNYTMYKLKVSTENVGSYLNVTSESGLSDRYLMDYSVMKSLANNPGSYEPK